MAFDAFVDALRIMRGNSMIHWGRQDLDGKILSMLSSDKPLTEKDLQEIRNDLEAIKNEAVEHVNSVLADLEGKKYKTLAEKKEVVEAIQDVARSTMRRLLCPKCGRTAWIRVVQSGGSKQGIYLFEHGKTTHSGGSSFPKTRLVTEDEIENQEG